VTRAAIARGLVLTVLLAACATAETGPRPITEDEADRLADVLYTSFQDGGASFTLSSLWQDGTTVQMSGDIDFAGHAGLAELVSTGPDAKVTGIAWYNDTVLEYIPSLVALAEEQGHAPFRWVARAADTDTYRVDVELSILRALASDVRENPQLLRQNGATWQRDDTLNGVDVEVFQYGDATRFWVQKGTTRLLRFEGNNSDGNNPVIIDFSKPGVRKIDLPTLEETVAIQDVAELYATARKPD
jgi:hypothetical protein